MTMLQPAPGRQVRDPFTMQLLPAEGADIILNDFYLRRLRDGDVIDMDAATKPAEPLAEPAAQEEG
jgi:hypothetical protein